ncbi:MAG: hypothetical protein GX614_09630 [Sandaracinaceae bacterium]|nr:hypothetical protein [Sandaracinaceae bacterium]
MLRIFMMGAFVALFAMVGCNRSSEPRGHAATQGDERHEAKRSRDMKDGAKAKPGSWDREHERERKRRMHDDDYRDDSRELRHDIKEQSRETGREVKEESRTTIDSAKSETNESIDDAQRRLDD